MRRHRWITIAIGALLLGACGGGDDPTVAEGTGSPAESTASEAEGTAEEATEQAGDTSAAGVEVGTAATDLGTVLVDAEGRTLYLFDSDSDGASTCYESCAETWPPLTGGEATATGDAAAALLGTTERDDGSVQVTYAGFPLYLYAADTAPGDVNGQGVGGVWWVVGPDGERVTGDAAASRTPRADDDY